MSHKSVSESILRPRQTNHQRGRGVSFYGFGRGSSSSRSSTPSRPLLEIRFQNPTFRETNRFQDPAFRETNRFHDPTFRDTNRLQDPTFRDTNRFKDPTFREANRFHGPTFRETNRFPYCRPQSDLFYNNSSASTASSSLSEYLKRRPRSRAFPLSST